MDLLYSLSLLLALVVGTLGGLLAAWAWIMPASGAWRRRWALRMLGIGGGSLLVSVFVHAYWGHGPASAEPMDVVAFVTLHPSFGVAALILLLGVAAGFAARKRQARGPGAA